MIITTLQGLTAVMLFQLRAKHLTLAYLHSPLTVLCGILAPVWPCWSLFGTLIHGFRTHSEIDGDFDWCHWVHVGWGGQENQLFIRLSSLCAGAKCCWLRCHYLYNSLSHCCTHFFTKAMISNLFVDNIVPLQNFTFPHLECFQCRIDLMNILICLMLFFVEFRP